MEHGKTKIKICGIRRLEDVSYINDIKPDYIGFVFVRGRKRYVEPAQARELRRHITDEVKAVGVFIDAPPEEIVEIAAGGTIDMVQLHGNEDNSYIAKLRELLDESARERCAGDQRAGNGSAAGNAENAEIPIIQAFVMKTAEDVRLAEASDADYLLLDSGTGTGRRFDWRILEEAGGVNRSFFLAGGLGPDNVEEAIRRIQPFAVDLSSGVETDGIKDGEKIAAVVRAVRKADAL